MVHVRCSLQEKRASSGDTILVNQLVTHQLAATYTSWFVIWLSWILFVVVKLYINTNNATSENAVTLFLVIYFRQRIHFWNRNI